MKRFLLICLAFFFFSSLSAQTSSIVKLDSLHLTTRNLFDANMDTPPSVFDTASLSRKVELNIIFYIKNVWELDSLELRYGATPGADDLLDLSFDYKVIDSVAYLVGHGNQFPIINGKVFIPYLIPEVSLIHPDHVWIRARDTQGRFSNILTDIN